MVTLRSGIDTQEPNTPARQSDVPRFVNLGGPEQLKGTAEAQEDTQQAQVYMAGTAKNY
jgi:hypothetical protein